MDKFIDLIKHDDLTRILSGTFDLSRVPTDRHRVIFLMAAHCCLNGPVGTNKPTTFPLVEGTNSISGHIGVRVSNNSWRAFCQDVATVLARDFRPIVQQSQQFTVSGGLWPSVPSISEARRKV